MKNFYLFQKEKQVIDREFESEKIRKIFKEENSFFWFDLLSPDEEEIKILKEVFKFHPLAIEDCIDQIQGTKIEEYEDYIFFSLPVINYSKKEFITAEIGIFLGKNFLVTVHQEEVSQINNLREKLEKNLDLSKKGVDFIFYLLIDLLVDNYFLILDNMEEKIDYLEDEVVINPQEKILNRIFEIKKEIMKIRKNIESQREVFNIFNTKTFPYISQEIIPYLRNTYDHLVRIYDIIELQREVISNILEAYLSNVSNRMNEIMKKLTIIATIFMPLSFIASFITGLFGMNVFIPFVGNEKYKNSVFGLIILFIFIISIIVTFFMLRWFKKRGWD
jgi:magnesium transporter